MNINQAAAESGLPVKTIRYYEEIGLVAPTRQDNGCRDYAGPGLHKLTFLQRSRGLGFSIEDCRVLLSLYEDKDRASSDVEKLAETHDTRINQKISELQSLRSTLGHLIASCRSDTRADCPILNNLAGEHFS